MSKSKQPDTVTAGELLERLKRHYIKPGDLMPGGAFLPEVVLGSRRADALYVGFFRSRGKMLVGHEIKVSRADWVAVDKDVQRAIGQRFNHLRQAQERIAEAVTAVDAVRGAA